jgi:hypothetical protein
MMPTGPTGPVEPDPQPTGPGEPMDPGGLPPEPPTPDLSLWQKLVLWIRKLFR